MTIGLKSAYSLVEDSSERSLHISGVVHIYHPYIGLPYGLSIGMLGCHLKKEQGKLSFVKFLLLS